jgi:hypothetical protein
LSAERIAEIERSIMRGARNTGGNGHG